MHRRNLYLHVAACFALFHLAEHRAWAVTEVRLDKDFLAGIVEKLPPSPFEKKGQYRGTVHSYRLLAIDTSAGGSCPPARSRESSGRP